MRLGNCFLGLLLGGFLSASALAQEPAAKGATVRPEIGKPVQAALELLKQKKAKEALAKMREAQAVGEQTAYETYLVERVLGQAAAAAGEHAIAARAFETVAGSAATPESERKQFLAAAASEHYQVKNYAKSAELAARYFREGGADKSVRTVYIQALYLSNNYAAAAKELMADVEAEEKAGTIPQEAQLQLLANATAQQRDAAGNAKAMEKLLAYYPKRDYWLNAIHGLVSRQGYSERLAIDVARLKLETGTIRSADEYVDAAQLSLQEGFPVEATRIIEQGYAAGLLGKGAEADRHKRLKDMAAKTLAEDKKTLAADAASVGAGKDGKTLFNDGFNLVLHGKADRGLAMMEKGILDKASFRRPEHAKLQLAYAYHLAGQKQKAIQLYRTVQGADGAAALGRLWAIRLAHAS